MTILFAGGEDTSFASLTGTGSTGGTTGRRASFSRLTIERFGTNTADPPGSRATSPSFTASSDLWFHAQLAAQNNTATSNGQLLRLLDGGTARIAIRGTGTAGTFKISTRNAAGTFADLVTASAITLSNTPGALDLHIIYAVSGSAILYWNGTQIATFSGDVTTNSATTLSGFEIACNSSGDSSYWSEMIVATEDTRGMSLWTLAPQASGNTQSWTPNTVGNINENTINDATLISSSSNNELSEWTTPTSAPSGNWGVKAIVQEARVQVGTTGPQHFDWVVRTASTDYTAGVSNAPNTSFGNFSNYQWATNPNTSAPWAITDIASGFNLGIKSLA